MSIVHGPAWEKENAWWLEMVQEEARMNKFWEPHPSLIVRCFGNDWVAILTPEHRVAFHVPTGEIMPMADERCPLVCVPWGLGAKEKK